MFMPSSWPTALVILGTASITCLALCYVNMKAERSKNIEHINEKTSTWRKSCNQFITGRAQLICDLLKLQHNIDAALSTTNKDAILINNHEEVIAQIHTVKHEGKQLRDFNFTSYAIENALRYI